MEIGKQLGWLLQLKAFCEELRKHRPDDMEKGILIM